MLASRVSLVTGSTSGIGLGIAKVLASQGSSIVLNGFGSSNEIENLLKEFHDKYKVKAIYSDADLSQVNKIEEMINFSYKNFNKIDILVNNAGIQYTEKVENFPVDKWNLILDINLSAVFHTTRLVLPQMKQNNYGRIINIASVHGLVASTEKSAYVAAKHGVIGLTKVTALENAAYNVTANSICPGWVLTPLVQKQIDNLAAKDGITIDQAREKLLLAKQPSGKFVTPEQLGQLALFLSSDAASEVRGQSWAMDGGWTAQ